MVQLQSAVLQRGGAEMGAPEPSGVTYSRVTTRPYMAAPPLVVAVRVWSPPPPSVSPLIRRHDMLVCILASRELPFRLGHVIQDLHVQPLALAYDTLIYSCPSVIVRAYTCPRPCPPPTRCYPAAQLGSPVSCGM